MSHGEKSVKIKPGRFWKPAKSKDIRDCRVFISFNPERN